MSHFGERQLLARLRDRRVLGSLGVLAGLVAFCVAYANRFDRDWSAFRDEDGWTSYGPLPDPEQGNLDAPVLAEDSNPGYFSPFDFWDPYLWAGAGFVLLAVGLLIFATGWNRARARS